MPRFYHVISPHLDDAALSCTMFLAANPGSRLTTVFASGPASVRPLTPWDRAARYFAEGADVTGVRRAEDSNAAALVNATAVHLTYWDRQYRNPGYGYSGPDEQALAPVIADDLLKKDAENPAGAWVIPLGLGHPDHRLASDAGLLCASQLWASQHGAGQSASQRGASQHRARQSASQRGASQDGDGQGASQRGDGQGASQRGVGQGASQRGASLGASQRGDGQGASQHGVGQGASQHGDGQHGANGHQLPDIFVYEELPYAVEDYADVADRKQSLAELGFTLVADDTLEFSSDRSLKMAVFRCHTSQRRALRRRARTAVRTPERVWRLARS